MKFCPPPPPTPCPVSSQAFKWKAETGLHLGRITLNETRRCHFQKAVLFPLIFLPSFVYLDKPTLWIVEKSQVEVVIMIENEELHSVLIFFFF